LKIGDGIRMDNVALPDEVIELYVKLIIRKEHVTLT
jgi:hypothetical protein